MEVFLQMITTANVTLEISNVVELVLAVITIVVVAAMAIVLMMDGSLILSIAINQFFTSYLIGCEAVYMKPP